MDQQDEIIKQFRQQQEKYAYYIIALCVTAIGFSVVKTNGQTLKWTQLPLSLAVLSWGLSIYCGLKFLRYVISTLYSNYEYFEIIKGRDPEIGKHPERIKAAVTGITKAMQSNSDVTSKFATWQDRFFFCGIVLFLIWHIVEMYINT